MLTTATSSGPSCQEVALTRSQHVTLSTAAILAILAALTLSGCTDAVSSGTDGTPAIVVSGSGGAG
jgi:hypothetical protein